MSVVSINGGEVVYDILGDAGAPPVVLTPGGRFSKEIRAVRLGGMEAVTTLIIRGGERDIDHPKRTSLEVSCLIEGSRLIDPPWPEDAWEQANRNRHKHERYTMFDTWVLAAPAILDFLSGSTR